jgi:hypothetical protein
MAVTIDGSANTVTATSTFALGVGQTWQDVTASRAAGTTYTNSTGRSIQVSVTCSQINGTGTGNGYITVSGVIAAKWEQFVAATTPARFPMCIIIPAGATYTLTLVNSALNYWAELR